MHVYQPTWRYGFHTQRTKLIEDPRPTSDGVYLQGCISKIKTFLLKEGQVPFSLVENSKTPHLDEINRILPTIFTSLDKKIRLGNKLWEDVPFLMRALQYPFKCGLTFSDMDQLWKNLVSMLVWLIDIQLYRDKSKEKSDVSKDTHLVFTFEILQMYKSFLNGADFNNDLMIKSFQASCNKKLSKARITMSECSKECGKMSESLRYFNPHSTSINEQKQLKLALEHRKNINIKAIASNLEQASVVKTSIDDFQIKLQMREEKLLYKLRENEHLIESSHMMDRDEISMFPNKSDSPESFLIQNVTAERKKTHDYLKACGDLRIATGADLQNLLKKYQEYIKSIASSTYFPDELKKIKYTSITMDLLISKFKVGSKHIAPITDLNVFFNACVQQSRRIEAESVKMTEVLYGSHKLTKERRDDIVSKECLLSDSENRYQEQRGEIDHLVAKLLSKIKEREGEVNDLKSVNRNLVQKTDHIAHRLHHEYKEFIQTCQNDKSKAQRLLLTSLDSLMIHKQELQTVLKF